MDQTFIKDRLRLLLDHFSVVGDPREACKVKYPLPEVLFLGHLRFDCGVRRLRRDGRLGIGDLLDAELRNSKLPRSPSPFKGLAVSHLSEPGHRLYVSCGDGHIAVLMPRRACPKFPRLRPGKARTLLVVPALDRLFLGVPMADGQPAEIQVLHPADVLRCSYSAVGRGYTGMEFHADIATTLERFGPRGQGLEPSPKGWLPGHRISWKHGRSRCPSTPRNFPISNPIAQPKPPPPHRSH